MRLKRNADRTSDTSSARAMDHHTKAEYFREYVCGRQDENKLPAGGYDEAVNTVSKCLEYGACNDSKPGKDEAQRNDP